MIGAYHLGGCCRFIPSCSDYAIIAINKHNIYYAIILIIKRLLKCRPGSDFGFDPVPSTALEKEKNTIKK